MSAASHTAAAPGESVAAVERFLAAFSDRWPTHDEIRAIVTPDVVFVERPNLVNPTGGERDLAGMLAGADAGQALLSWQRYEVRDHLADGDRVATRMRWSGELAIDAGAWPAGTVLTAWCVAHYVVEGGRIAHIEQHDCYDPVATG